MSADSAAATPRPGEAVGDAAAEALISVNEDVKAPLVSMPLYFAAGTDFDAELEHRLAEEVAEAFSGTERACSCEDDVRG